MIPMKLIIVRHGETVANTKRIIQGRESNKLTEKGKDQAKEAGRHLKKHKIDMVFCSPLDRCVETLENIMTECEIEGEIFMSNLIEERFMGEYVGSNLDMVDWKEIDKDNKINREMGVESLNDFKKRVELFLEDLKLEEGEKTVLVVSHAGPIEIMVDKITGKEMEIKNAQVIELDYETSLDFDYSK